MALFQSRLLGTGVQGLVVNKHIIHLNGGFAKQRLYHDMARAISEYGVRQSFFVPVRTQKELDYQGPGLEDGRYVAQKIISPHHKLFFRSKIKKIASALVKEFDMDGFSLCHAHFLYSDGGVALKLKQSFGLKYIVAVRNTDINFFMPYRPDLKNIMLEIAANAERLVFLNPAYRDYFLSVVPHESRPALRHKACIIPNALGNEWFEAMPDHKQHADTVRILYVGDFSKNKNIFGLIKACEVINQKQSAHLTLVGGGGDGERKIMDYLDSQEGNLVTYAGRVSDRDELRSIYASHDVFAMPSFKETFGLVYLEALSQGIPVVHSIGQGVDGLFAGQDICQPVNPNDVGSIAEGILGVFADGKDKQSACRESVKDMTWDVIGKQIVDLYDEILEPGTGVNHD